MLLTADTVEQLLQPISEESPCGEYLKGNRTLFRSLRNDFNLAQTSFRKVTQNPDPAQLDELMEENQQNWKQLATHIIETLGSSSKDIEIIGWLIAAQLFIDDSFAGLAHGMVLLEKSFEAFWPAIQPELPETKLKQQEEAGQLKERAEHKLKILKQLIGETEDSGLLYLPLRIVPLVGAINGAEFLSAERQGKLVSTKEEAQKYVQSNRSIIEQKVKNLHDAFLSVEAIERFLFEQGTKVGVNGPSLRFIKQAIELNLKAIEVLTGIKRPKPVKPVAAGQESSQAAESGQVTVDSNQAGGSPHVASDNLSDSATYSRDHAFHTLRQIADFFRQNEPHSPISYLLEKAIRWGYMSLPELLNELLEENKNSLQHIALITGLDQDVQVDLPEVKVPVKTNTEVTSQQTADSISESEIASEEGESQQDVLPETKEESSQSSGGLQW